MAFFTADICDEYSDKVFVLEAGYRNYGGADKCQGEIVTIKLDRNNSDLIALLRDEDGAGKVVVVDVEQAHFAVVGENLMKFADKNKEILDNDIHEIIAATDVAIEKVS